MASCLRITVAAAFIISALMASTCEGGEYVILEAPPSVQFDQTTSDALPISDIPQIVLATFGYHPQPDMAWTGLYQVSPFHTVNSAVLFTLVSYPGSPIDGSILSKLVPPDAVRFSTVQDNNDVDVGEVINTLSSRKSSIFLDVRLLDDGNLEALTDVNGPFGNLSEWKGSLPVSGYIDELMADGSAAELVVELGVVRHVLDMLKARRQRVELRTQDFFHFRLEGLAKMSARHGSKSKELAVAVKKVESFIRQVADEFFSIYAGNAVVQMVTMTETRPESSAVVLESAADGATGPGRRQLLQSSTTEANITLSSLNLAPSFSWFYPEMFNIGLWFTIVFTLIVFGVSWCMWFIDPGYDGVIYRLTTQPRMKVD